MGVWVVVVVLGSGWLRLFSLAYWFLGCVGIGLACVFGVFWWFSGLCGVLVVWVVFGLCDVGLR